MIEDKLILDEFCKVMSHKLDGQIYKLKNKETPNGNVILDTICSTDGTELDDIYTKQDSEDTADFILNKVKELCRKGDPLNNDILHVSIAGGRKTMSFYAGYALSLFGRIHDRLSHVLIESEPNKPSEFEKSRNFYFPEQTTKVCTFDGKELNPREANLALAEIPVVKLGNQLPHNLTLTENHKKISYSQLVNRIQRSFDKENYKLSFNNVNTTIYCNDEEIKLEKRQYILFLTQLRYFYETKLGENFQYDFDFVLLYLKVWYFIEKRVDHKGANEELQKPFNESKCDDFNKAFEEYFANGKQIEEENFLRPFNYLSGFIYMSSSDKHKDNQNSKDEFYSFERPSDTKKLYIKGDNKTKLFDDIKNKKLYEQIKSHLLTEETEKFQIKTLMAPRSKASYYFILPPAQINFMSSEGILTENILKADIRDE